MSREFGGLRSWPGRIGAAAPVGFPAMSGEYMYRWSRDCSEHLYRSVMPRGLTFLLPPDETRASSGFFPSQIPTKVPTAAPTTLRLRTDPPTCQIEPQRLEPAVPVGQALTSPDEMPGGKVPIAVWKPVCQP